MKYIFAGVYVLVLATQLPHVWHAYASLEASDVSFAAVTAWGAAIAFELATGIFTYRVVSGTRRAWTKRGLAFFIAGSAIANAHYYRVWPAGFAIIMPVFATLALPIALALFAEEFGVETKREQRARQKAERAERSVSETKSFSCDVPGCGFVAMWPTERYGDERSARNALAGHKRAHRNDNKEKVK